MDPADAPLLDVYMLATELAEQCTCQEQIFQALQNILLACLEARSPPAGSESIPASMMAQPLLSQPVSRNLGFHLPMHLHHDG